MVHALIQEYRRYEAVSLSEGPIESEVSTCSKSRPLFHSMGFDSIYLLFHELKGNPRLESAKIALLHDFRTTCYVSILHLVPLITSVTAIVLNWKGYYIGGELSGAGKNGLKFLGLQFAPKMQELLAMASFSSILFTLLTHQLLFHKLPFVQSPRDLSSQNYCYFGPSNSLRLARQRLDRRVPKLFWLLLVRSLPFSVPRWDRQQLLHFSRNFATERQVVLCST
jgi:hypothetical protein